MRTARWLAALAGALAVCAIPSAASAQSPPPDSQFQKVPIDQTPGEPIDLAVLPDGRVLHTERSGEVWLHDPDTGLKTLAAKLDVYSHDEEGLQSIAIDPNFAQNGWIYLYYSPPLNTPVDNPATPTVNEGDAPEFGTAADFAPFKGYIQLSRFQWAGDSIDLDTEQKILQVPVDRGICCHVGGDIVFDGNGNLLLSTGDDTNPFQSDGFTPIDERPNRNPAFDAQRTAANTNDLRGKVLRITPTEGGGYSIPEGNLFADNDPLTRPEIYLMGLRNPFRIEFNRETQELYIADYSPDASAPNPLRGPAGQGKWSVVTKAANFGWPYCATARAALPGLQLRHGGVGSGVRLRAPGQPVAEQHGRDQPAAGDAAGRLVLVHRVRRVPRARDRWHRPDGRPGVPVRRQGGQGQEPDRLAGVLRQRPALLRVDARLHQGLLHRGRRRDADRERACARSRSSHPIDMEFGPNGSLYVLNYGNGFFGKNLPGAELVRIDYLGPKGDRTPTVNGGGRRRRGLRAADGSVHEHGLRPGGPQAQVRVGLRRGRQRGFARAEPVPHVHRGGRVSRHPAGDRPGRSYRLGLRGDHRRPAADGRPHRHDRCERVPVR